MGGRNKLKPIAAAFYDWFVCLVFILKILPGEEWNKLFKIPNVSSTWLIKQMFPCGMFKFVYFLVVVGLCSCAEAFSNCSEQGLLPSCGARASHCGAFSCCRNRLSARGLR